MEALPYCAAMRVLALGSEFLIISTVPESKIIKKLLGVTDTEPPIAQKPAA
jgi:hypothetical protein